LHFTAPPHPPQAVPLPLEEKATSQQIIGAML